MLLQEATQASSFPAGWRAKHMCCVAILMTVTWCVLTQLHAVFPAARQQHPARFACCCVQGYDPGVQLGVAHAAACASCTHTHALNRQVSVFVLLCCCRCLVLSLFGCTCISASRCAAAAAHLPPVRQYSPHCTFIQCPYFTRRWVGKWAPPLASSVSMTDQPCVCGVWVWCMLLL